jgi:hypothetical protein
LESSFDVSLKGLPFCFVALRLLGFHSELVIFYSTLMGIFERILGSTSLECPKAFLLHPHVALPISSEGIMLISLEVIVPTVYLGSWALVAFVITFRFVLDLCSFLLEAIGVNSLVPLPFYTHLRLM